MNPTPLLLFLDFDGVLHPDGAGVFSKLALFEAHLARMPRVEVVISSSWREEHSLTELRHFFSADVRERVIGVTPSLEDGYDRGGRQREIHAWLEHAGLHAGNARWIVLDDVALFFEDHYPQVILTDPAEGFSEKDGEALLAWYHGQPMRRA